MIINLLNRNLARVLLFLAISPGSRYSRTEIREKTGLNNVPLDYALSELLILKMIKSEKRLYSLNLENEIVRQIFNETKERIGSLPLKIQFVLLDFVSAISRMRGVASVILFGSYAKLIYSDKSDVDIAVVFASEELMKKGREKVKRVAEKVGKKHKKEIQIHSFAESDLKHKEDSLIRDILRNGRVIV